MQERIQRVMQSIEVDEAAHRLGEKKRTNQLLEEGERIRAKRVTRVKGEKKANKFKSRQLPKKGKYSQVRS